MFTFPAIAAAYISCLIFLAALAGYDQRRYPVCRPCEDNLQARRPRLLRRAAECRVHGRFRA